MKMFVGAQVRRAREERGLTQAALARLIGISSSYLNQIERDQRPLTVPVLLRLNATVGFDAHALSEDEGARLIAGLDAALTDPAAGVEQPVPASEIREIVTGFPALARAVVVLHRRASVARRRAEEMAIGLGASLPEGERLPVLPYDEVLDFVYDNRNHFPALDTAAEALDAGDLERLLAARHGVRVAVSDHDADRRRLDRATGTLHLPRGLAGARRTFQVAVQWCLLEHAADLDRLAAAPGLSGDESRALARIGLANYFAGAVLLPYGPFLAEAEATGYDVGLLADRFGVSIETVCHRLSTMQRPGAEGVPFFFVRVDRAGNISKRHSATHFHFSRTGGTCPLWNVYEAFSSPGRFVTQVAEMPDGRRYLWVARTIGRRVGAYGEPGVQHAVALGCDVRHAPRLVYSRGLAVADPATAVPIGPGCRLCERDACPQRAFPLVGRALHIDEDRSRRVPYPAA
jgi:predicted transcriptional regulator/transcriptional regulator with XRE-family HTH domain